MGLPFGLAGDIPVARHQAKLYEDLYHEADVSSRPHCRLSGSSQTLLISC